MMQHNKNVGKERQTIALLPLFVTVLFVWLLKFTNGLLRGGEIYLLRHDEIWHLPYLPLKLCQWSLTSPPPIYSLSATTDPPHIRCWITTGRHCCKLGLRHVFAIYLVYLFIVFMRMSQYTIWTHSRLWCLIALSRLRMRTADYPFPILF